MTHTTTEGFTLTVFPHTLYLDFGLAISKGDEQVFYSPHCLSRESYGFSPAERFETWDEADLAAMDGDETAFVPWTAARWTECLVEQEVDLLMCFLGME